MISCFLLVQNFYYVIFRVKRQRVIFDNPTKLSCASVGLSTCCFSKTATHKWSKRNNEKLEMMG